MAVEARRGCGYRKVGGLYLVSGGGGVPCDRLPIRLDVCPVCSHGFKQTRGWTWVDLFGLVGGNHEPFRMGPCPCRQGMPMSVGSCPLCHDVKQVGKAGLLWIGEKYYPTPDAFIREGTELGLSRRISAIPRKFKVGETWVMLAHSKTILAPIEEQPTEASGAEPPIKYLPGIFTLCRPSRIEKIFKESDRESDEVKQALEQGITPVFVPDNDPDHQARKKPGEVEDDEEETAEVTHK